MVVDRVFGFQLDGFVVALNGFLILLERVIGSSQISVISAYFRIDIDSVFDAVDLLVVSAQLSQSFSLVVIELALFGQFQPDVAALYHIFIFVKSQVGISFEKVRVLVIRECADVLEKPVVVLFVFVLLDFVEGLAVVVFGGFGAVPVVKLDIF